MSLRGVLDEAAHSPDARTATDAVDELRRRGVAPWFVLDEGGAVAADAFPLVRAPLAVVGVTEKGVTSVELVAEGVEDAHTAAELVAMGVDVLQGFHIAAPMRAAELASWVRHWSARRSAERSDLPELPIDVTDSALRRILPGT